MLKMAFFRKTTDKREVQLSLVNTNQSLARWNFDCPRWNFDCPQYINNKANYHVEVQLLFNINHELNCGTSNPFQPDFRPPLTCRPKLLV